MAFWKPTSGLNELYRVAREESYQNEAAFTGASQSQLAPSPLTLQVPYHASANDCTRLVPSKRDHTSFSHPESVLSLSDDEDVGAATSRPLKRGRGANEPIEPEIPCICYMSGEAGYEKCVKRHKYLSHLARHLHKHDIYVCQMCFTKFDGFGKERNLKRKQEHHCIKLCNDGKCQRQRLEDGNKVHRSNSCEHLVTWQDRWNELFRAVYPGIAKIPALPRPIAQRPKQQRQQRLDTSMNDLLSSGPSDMMLEPSGVPSFASTQFSHRALPLRAQSNLALSFETHTTEMERTASSAVSERRTASLKSPLSSYHGVHAQLEAIRGNATTFTPSPSHSNDIMDNIGYGAADIDTHSPYVDDIVMSDQQDIKFTQSLQEVSLQGLMARVDELEKQGDDRQQRIEALEAALQRSLHREEELQLELTAVSRRPSG